jgi:hypothetical protein
MVNSILLLFLLVVASSKSITSVHAIIPTLVDADKTEEKINNKSTHLSPLEAQSQLQTCPHYEAFGCLGDILEKICNGDTSVVQQDAGIESIWYCCCPEPYIRCEIEDMHPTCSAALHSVMSDYEKNSLDPNLSSNRQGTDLSAEKIVLIPQKIREMLWNSHKACQTYFAKPKPYSKCLAKKTGGNQSLMRVIERFDLNCEALTWQYKILGDGTSEAFLINKCPLPSHKSTEGSLRKVNNHGNYTAYQNLEKSVEVSAATFFLELDNRVRRLEQGHHKCRGDYGANGIRGHASGAGGCATFRSKTIEPRNDAYCTQNDDPNRRRRYSRRRGGGRRRDFCVKWASCRYSQWECASCSPGEYVTGKYRTGSQRNWNQVRHCEACPSGHACGDGKKKSACAAGKKSSADRRKCEECSAGRYQNEVTQTSCKLCPPGMYQERQGTLACKSCEPGQYQHQGTSDDLRTSCTACPAAWHQNDRGKIVCKQCQVGRKEPTANNANCKLCPKGFYQNEEMQKKCKDCLEGQYQDTLEQTTCKDCPTGYKYAFTRGAACKRCVLGQYTFNTDDKNSDSPPEELKYLGNGGHNGCAQCPKGRASNLYAHSISFCINCPVGWYNNVVAQRYCSECPGGFYQNEVERLKCNGCPTGYYQFSRKQTGCEVCPDGKYQVRVKATSCNACPAGSHMNAKFCKEENIYVKIKPKVCPASVPKENRALCDETKYEHQVDIFNFGIKDTYREKYYLTEEESGPFQLHNGYYNPESRSIYVQDYLRFPNFECTDAGIAGTDWTVKFSPRKVIARAGDIVTQNQITVGFLKYDASSTDDINELIISVPSGQTWSENEPLILQPSRLSISSSKATSASSTTVTHAIGSRPLVVGDTVTISGHSDGMSDLIVTLNQATSATRAILTHHAGIRPLLPGERLTVIGHSTDIPGAAGLANAAMNQVYTVISLTSRDDASGVKLWDVVMDGSGMTPGNYYLGTIRASVGSSDATSAMNQRFTVAEIKTPTEVVLTGNGMTPGTYTFGKIVGDVDEVTKVQVQNIEITKSDRDEEMVANDMCRKCPKGWYGPSRGIVICLPCEVQQYQPMEGSQDCLYCKNVKWYKGVSNAHCSERGSCAPGASMCPGCPRGQYGENSCHSEASDFVANTIGNYFDPGWTCTLCTDCPKGQYSAGGDRPHGCPPIIEWTIKFNSQRITAKAGDIVTQNNKATIGILKSSLSGIVDSVVVKAQRNQRFNTGTALEINSIVIAQSNLISSNHETVPCVDGSRSVDGKMGRMFTCDPCWGGRYADQVKSDRCKKCGKGKYSEALVAISNSTCKNCPPGRFSDREGLRIVSQCKRCVKGRYSKEIGAISEISCKPCLPGRYSLIDGRWKDECDNCLPGYFNSAQAQVRCERCPKGWYQDEIESADCKMCTTGMFQNSGGSEQCKDCRGGFYQDQYGTIQCKGCVPGTYQASTREKSCRNCDPGQYQPVTSQQINGTLIHAALRCIDCESNSFESGAASRKCFVCPSGWFTGYAGGIDKNTGAKVCLPCPAGTHWNNAKQHMMHGPYNTTYLVNSTMTHGLHNISECRSCPAGFMSLAGPKVVCLACQRGRYGEKEEKSEACVACVPGKFSSVTAAKSVQTCQNCPNGKFSAARGAVAEDQCVLCPPGKRGNATFGGATGSDTCLNCKSGYFEKIPGVGGNNLTGTSKDLMICIYCPSGYNSPAAGSAFCHPCNNGEYQKETGQTLCIQCPPGKYQPKPKQGFCFDCAMGQVTPNDGSVSCSKCIPGKYENEERQSLCDICSPGEYQELDGSRTAKLCPAGYMSSIFAAESCRLCIPGTYQTEDGFSKCPICIPGMYQANAGGNRSVACPTGYFTEYAGSASCLKCYAGQYQDNEGSTSCKKCESGKFASNATMAGCIPCKRGKWSELRGGSSICVACEPGNYAPSKTYRIGDTNSIYEESLTEAGEKHVFLLAECKKASFYAQNVRECQINNIDTELFDPNFQAVTQYPLQVFQKPPYVTYDGNGVKNSNSFRNCLACPAGYFQNSKGAVKCLKCDESVAPFYPKKYIPNNRSTACERPLYKIPMDCKDKIEYLDDTHADPMFWNCVSCPLPAGACYNNPTSEETKAHQGYWPIPTSYWKDSKIRVAFARCPVVADCLGVDSMNYAIEDTQRVKPGDPVYLSTLGCRCAAEDAKRGNQNSTNVTNATTPEENFYEKCNSRVKGCCRFGSTGPVCSECISGYIRMGSVCTACAPNEIGIRLFVAVFSAITIIVLFVCLIKPYVKRLHQRYGSAWREIMAILKINVDFQQINSSMPTGY